MRIKDVRISGFKSIPFCADFSSDLPANQQTARKRNSSYILEWHSGHHHVRLPTENEDQSMLSAIMGANSAGKSTILLALNYAFSPVSKFDSSLFNRKQIDQPVVVEMTLTGPVSRPRQWHELNCTAHETNRGTEYELTVANVWTTESRLRLIKRADGRYYKQNNTDRAQCEALLPQFRIIMADTKLKDEVNLDKNGLMGDLLQGVLDRNTEESSVIGRIQSLVTELETLVDRAKTNGQTWAPIEELEESLSVGLAAITPQSSQVRLQLHRNIPSVKTIFNQGSLFIDDGVELDFDQHGLGLQRSFVVSTLRSWCEYIKSSELDYFFAIEEPEIYLHPHATRVLLNTLEEIAQHDQVIFTTHASEFINRVPLENIITVRRQEPTNQAEAPVLVSQVTQPDLSRLSKQKATKVQRYLSEDRSDMLFARSVILVEGQAELFALPAFARTLRLNLDAHGVSVVFVNGIGNFETYHHILNAFGIPHVILVDGDGQRPKREKEYRRLADAHYVLDIDFEAEIAASLPRERLLEIMAECAERSGKGVPTRLSRKAPGKDLAKLGKPLVGRVVGEVLTSAEVSQITPVVGALESAIQLAGGIIHRAQEEAIGV